MAAQRHEGLQRAAALHRVPSVDDHDLDSLVLHVQTSEAARWGRFPKRTDPSAPDSDRLRRDLHFPCDLGLKVLLD